MKYGFVRAFCAVPRVFVADIEENTKEICQSINTAQKEKAEIIVFPELCITGYTCSDLFFQREILEKSVCALEKIAEESKDFSSLIFVGLPISCGNAIFNAAAAIHRGKILAVIPKSYIPNYAEFYERRHFAPFESSEQKTIFLSAKNPEVPFGTDILICDEKNPLLKVAAEICEDLWTAQTPSTKAALAGANVIVNLSASNEIAGKADFRRLLVQSASARLFAAYIYANAGKGESTTDLVFSGHSLIAENGSILSENALFSNQNVIADIDFEKLVHERERTTTFFDCAQKNETLFRIIKANFLRDEDFSILQKIAPNPFVPQSLEKKAERCHAVVEMQAQGLAKRLSHTKAKSAVVGLSGGLDSTLALLVIARSFDILSIPRQKIVCVTLPCFGTTNRTYQNALSLSKEIGAQILEINIEKAVRQHFLDIGQDENTHDATYENSQARERTQILMDIANKTGGLVIGTGDLSELALGWATYNGDQMSMYGVNASIPKTLVRHLVGYFSEEARKSGKTALSAVLNDILETPVSPELIPPNKNGEISQKTEDLVGPYELHDFFLYYVLRFGFSPKKIFFLAKNAFQNQYELKEIKKWLTVFYRRFFSQQFKRSCMPDGAKVGTVSLSPRGDWRMPSDACSSIWVKEAEALEC